MRNEHTGEEAWRIFIITRGPFPGPGLSKATELHASRIRDLMSLFAALVLDLKPYVSTGKNQKIAMASARLSIVLIKTCQ